MKLHMGSINYQTLGRKYENKAKWKHMLLKNNNNVTSAFQTETAGHSKDANLCIDYFIIQV